MWVEAVSNESPILATARTLCRVTSDGCVSAAEVATKLRQPSDEILRALEGLVEVDWVARFDEDWTVAPTTETRWVLRQHPSLTLGKRYEVLEITGDYYRVLDNSDDPVLFHNSCFRVVDSSEPTFWERSVDEDGDRWFGPALWSRPCYFEEYHDGKQSIRDAFWNELRELYPSTWEQRRTGS